MKKFNLKKGCYSVFVCAIIFLITIESRAQQDAQYTQYMYNTQVVNPAYAGSREFLNFGLLLRSQWVGLEGAPKTGTFTVNSPIGALKNMGLGLSIVSEEIGPTLESNVNIDYSYTINTSYYSRLSFGLKAGVDVLNVNFDKLNIFEVNDVTAQNIDNKFQPQIGAGIYFYTDRFYAGLSVPNFLTTKHFDGNVVAAERLHYFLIAGYVFDINENLKFKPATLVKAVGGAPVQWDASANFLIYDKLTLGASYRLSASLSAMAGFQISDQLFIGFGYDYDTTDLQGYNNGSYEVFLRFDIFNKSERVLTPRFF